jgi:hypothetical protein
VSPNSLSHIYEAPHHAVQVAHDGRRFVWLAGGGTATRRFVQTGALNSRGVEITSGLSDRELLVVEGFSKVSEGMKLSVQLIQNDLAQIPEQYKAGIFILSDLLDAQNLLQRSRDQYVEAATEYCVKRAEYRQATGKRE